MEKKLIGILICMLLIATALPVTASYDGIISKTSVNSDLVEIPTEICGLNGGKHTVLLTKEKAEEVELLIDDIEKRLDEIETREEAVKIFYKSIVELNRLGLLPKGMSVRQAQRLVTGGFLNSLRMKLSHRFPVNQEVGEPGNVNCLVIGRTNWTFFRPYPVLLFDFPRISPWLWNNSLLAGLLIYPYLFRILLPFRFSTYTYFGSRYRITEQGNVTLDDIYSSSGWVWTIGSSGVKKWNGSFYGDLYCKYKKIVSDNDHIWENWDPVGIDDFTGVNLNFLGKLEPSIKMFYVGFARQVSFNYSYPW